MHESDALPGDEALVARILSGEREAFGLLAERHVASLTAIAYAHTQDREVARDIVQDALVSAFETLSGLRDPKAFASWVAGITRNLALSWVRHRGTERRGHRAMEEMVAQRSGMEGNASTDSPLEQAEQAESYRRVLDVLHALDAEAREIVLLRHADGVSRADAAGILGISPEAADKRLQRAMTALRARLAQE